MLNIEPNLARPDDFYEALIDLHRDLDDAQSQSANAQLILLLANHIGAHDVLLDAIRHAREGALRGAPAPVAQTGEREAGRLAAA
ncbi:DUF2783 domain-containing protein [Paraburkholderia caballeronis]|uniref:DUF2783 domain-containing protein n=1 Tax=Paraburkholderia caballeronis TaxID=416943 RepID=A0A1H7QP84_9BURK|nr:DUF2783 domain-containing protein [Paraburkholderia caballeronis]PXW22443.1 uncharacterized protein DUF2783 [Paraburkholderia caballeronis]PXW96314.1 uncharacterized protein DUF2783 [Paraburkholderia caballeronis]RAJ92725.1 uncharacterized protein DUF2783 [Paraburkholderia caballeronis]TDV34489.1 uncharacterized protein DUF2783 [Paraburkholderia caballeronis]SEE01312.1 Protein of unknown function [Paraburkholderia caballeronis]